MLLYFLVSLLIPFALLRSDALVLKKRTGEYIYRKDLYFIVAFSIPVLVKGLAYNTGADCLNYWDYYYDIALNRPLAGWAEHLDPGMKIIVRILIMLKLPVYSFFILCAALNYASYLNIAKLFPQAKSIVLLLWTPMFFVLSQNIYRQYIAMGFLVISIYYLLKNKQWSFWLWSICAAITHSSSIIAIVTMLLVKYIIKYNIKWYVFAFLIVLTTFVSSLFTDIITAMYSVVSVVFGSFQDNVYSLDEMFETKYNTSYVFVLSIIYISWCYFADKVKNVIPNFKFIYYYSALYFIAYPLCQQEILSRLALYFELCLPVMLGALIVFYKRKPLPLVILCGGVLIVYFLYFHSLESLLEDYPYRLCFSYVR